MGGAPAGLADGPELLALRGTGVTQASVVVKTCQADLPSYLHLQRDLLRFGYSAVRVCVPAKDLAAFEPIVAPSFELSSAEELLRRFGWHRPSRDDWHSQQLCKLLLAASCGTETCWMLDSNTLLLKPLPDPWHDGRVVLALGELQPVDRRWFAASARFLALPASGPPIAPVNQPLRRSVARALLERIAGLHSRPPLDALVAAMLAARRHGIQYWTEYGLYRSFAFHVARSAHLFRAGVRVVAYYRHDREGLRLAEWLGWLKRSRPQMVKVYARRPTYRLNDHELGRLCDRIRECR